MGKFQTVDSLRLIVILSIVAEGSLALREGEHHKRSYALQPGKVLLCPSARAGPPGPPGPPGLPGRDGRDGRDCPPCNCGAGTSMPTPTVPPVEPCAGGQPAMPQAPPGGEYHPSKRGRANQIADQRDQTSSGDDEPIDSIKLSPLKKVHFSWN